MEAKPVWSAARSKSLLYLRRSPEDTTLYQIIYNYRDNLENHWDELFSAKYGPLRQCVTKALDEYLNCGIIAFGCARAYCTNCKHSELIAFSCKKRGVCPSCSAKRSILFAEHVNQNVLLPHPHRHLVFTIPKRLRLYFKFDRSLLSVLHKAAWQAWREYVRSVFPDSKDTVTPAMVASLHTAGSFLSFHPHVHAIALNGALDGDSDFLELPSIDTDAIEAAFQRNVFQALFEKKLITEEDIVNMSSWEHSGFSVFAGDAFDDEERILFVARYLKKNPVALDSLKIEQNALDTSVTITKHLDDGNQTESFSPLKFLARLSQHVPNTWEQSVRYLGAYSARTRGARKVQHRLDSPAETTGSANQTVISDESEQSTSSTVPLTVTIERSVDDDKPTTSSTWARCIKKVYGVDPLICPKCSSRMKIVAFIHDHKEIKKIAEHLGITTWTKPPPIAPPSGTGSYDYSPQ